MGKFFEALKKSERTADRSQPKPAPLKAAQRAAEITGGSVPVSPLESPAGHEPPEETDLAQDQMDPRLLSFLEPDSPAGESIKLLRAKILTRDPKSRPRTIMVTSPQPGDGKSMMAVNLAINIAQGVNEYVILVDCDLRKPSLNKLLGIHTSSGVHEYLADGTPLESCLAKTSIKKLTLLAAGKPAPNPSELLSSEKMRQVIEELKRRYEDRYIILDTTPAQFAAETTSLASMVDAILLVIRSGKTARDIMLRALENIDRNKVMGIIFNVSDEDPKSYKYYYRYYRRAAK